MHDHPRTDVLRLGVGVGCVGGTVVEIAQKKKNKKQKSTRLSCSVETNQNLIYKSAQTEERSLLEKRRGKKKGSWKVG